MLIQNRYYSYDFEADRFYNDPGMDTTSFGHMCFDIYREVEYNELMENVVILKAKRLLNEI